MPYLHHLGCRWEDGHIGVAQEHFASNVLRVRLSMMLHAERGGDGRVHLDVGGLGGLRPVR